nr:hypothetical protein [Tanacetum cinerariifolium]
HQLGQQRIAAVAFARVIEVDDVEAHRLIKLVLVLQQLIVADAAQVVKLVVVDVHAEALGQPAVVLLAPQLVFRAQVHRVFVFQQALLLRKALVGLVEDVLHQVIVKQATEPAAGAQQQQKPPPAPKMATVRPFRFSLARPRMPRQLSSRNTMASVLLTQLALNRKLFLVRLAIMRSTTLEVHPIDWK